MKRYDGYDYEQDEDGLFIMHDDYLNHLDSIRSKIEKRKSQYGDEWNDRIQELEWVLQLLGGK